MQLEDRDLKDQAGTIETLLADMESFPDSDLRSKAEEIVQGLLLLYGEGLSRVLGIVWEATGGGEESDRLMELLAEDELVAHLMLLHDLHPVPIEERVAAALVGVRPYLESHGGNVELIGVRDGVAYLRLEGSCSGCPSSTMTLKLAIEEAVRKAAPDLDRIEAEGVVEPPQRSPSFIPLTELLPSRPAPATPAWTPVGALPELNGGDTVSLQVAGSPLMFVRLDNTFYAYRDQCPRCGASLGGGTLDGAEFACPQCDGHYDIRLAGRSLEAPDQHLDPVPLLVQEGTVKVAVHG